MALHGPIMVNGVAIGEWGAQRMVTGDYDRTQPQPYWAEVYHHGQKVWEGDIAHTPLEGAIALAAKVLSAVPSG